MSIESPSISATDAIGEFRDALSAIDQVNAESLFEQAMEGRSPIEVVESLVVPALQHIGRDWDEGRIALSQVYLSGRICEKLVERVLPPSDPDRKRQPRSAIVVLCDYHTLGKGIVYSVLRASGFELFDYGHMNVEELVERAIRDSLRVLLISVLMLPSALKVRDVREGLDARGVKIKIVVGGAPFQFDRELWREVGADAMGSSAAEAVAILDRWK